MAHQLNQRPGAYGLHANSLFLHTLIANMGLIFVDKVHDLDNSGLPLDFDSSSGRSCGRWLFGTEACLSQGFPVHPVFNKTSQLCSYNFPREDRKMRQVCKQMGNSMHTIMPFIVNLHGMMCWRAAPIDRTM